MPKAYLAAPFRRRSDETHPAPQQGEVHRLHFTSAAHRGPQRPAPFDTSVAHPQHRGYYVASEGG